MQRVLNLNHFAWPALKALGVLLVVVPVGMWLLHAALLAFGIHAPLLLRIARDSLLLGAGGLLLMLLLIVIEQIQDQYLVRRYDQSIGKRLPGKDGLAECPACGYRGLRPFEPACPNCGKELDESQPTKIVK